MTRTTRRPAACGLRPMTLVILTAASLACQREERRFSESPPAATAQVPVIMSALQPGAGTYPAPQTPLPYEHNAWAISEGQRLFTQMNCVGCHFHGGGGIGPPLMDDEWIYGSEPPNIFSTIVEGRPNGMPAFAGKLSNQQVWEIVAYVRTLSGLGTKGSQNGRPEEMEKKNSEQNNGPEKPKGSGIPKSAEMP